MEIHIALNADENYGKYICPLIVSILQNANPDDLYHFHIIADNFSKWTTRQITEQARRFKNAEISFVDAKAIFDQYGELLHIAPGLHFNRTTYLRIFAPDVFSTVDRLLYLDCDIIVDTDIAELYAQDIHGKTLGAAIDLLILSFCIDYENWYHYIHDTLLLNDKHLYFNAGVLLIDCQKWRKDNRTQKCLSILNQIKDPWFADQCILNTVFKDDISFIDQSWNFMTHVDYSSIMHHIKILEQHLNRSLYSSKNLKIIHYASSEKPWKSPSIRYAYIWWQYASMSLIYAPLKIEALSNIVATSASKITVKEHNYNSDMTPTIGNIEAITNPIFGLKKTLNRTEFYLFGLKIYKKRTFKFCKIYYLLGFIPVYKKKRHT